MTSDKWEGKEKEKRRNKEGKEKEKRRKREGTKKEKRMNKEGKEKEKRSVVLTEKRNGGLLKSWPPYVFSVDL
ncbi:MAG: hypothetical protein JSS89_09170 [Bacteroidetes bacterium]|nr:hypothetical protein [Bacteroidota bacterium]